MPLHIEVKVNSTTLGNLNIGRLDNMDLSDPVSRYVAWVGQFHDRLTEKNSAHFEHRYEDGALVCVRKGIEALEGKEITL